MTSPFLCLIDSSVILVFLLKNKSSYGVKRKRRTNASLQKKPETVRRENDHEGKDSTLVKHSSRQFLIHFAAGNENRKIKYFF